MRINGVRRRETEPHVSSPLDLVILRLPSLTVRVIVENDLPALSTANSLLKKSKKDLSLNEIVYSLKDYLSNKRDIILHF